MQGVAARKGGLGYFGFTYYEENADKLKAVKVDSGGAASSPSVETAQDGTYKPLARPLFIYRQGEVDEAPRGQGLRRLLHREQR